MSSDFNPFPALAKAAKGDLVAQREMAHKGIIQASETGDTVAAIEATVFARLAASHGNEGEKGTLISILAAARELCLATGDDDYAESLGAQTVAVISELADAGNELAAQTLNEVAKDCGVEIMMAANSISKMMKEGA